jgi:two-component system OmpR family response regulator
MPILPSILIVDDNPGVRDVWTEALTEAGYRAATARTGREALALLRAVAPDLILLDLRMPEMNGLEFLKALLGTTIPVLIVSGYLQEYAEALREAQLNVVGRLAKPVRPAELVRAVEATLVPPPRS